MYYILHVCIIFIFILSIDKLILILLISRFKFALFILIIGYQNIISFVFVYLQKFIIMLKRWKHKEFVGRQQYRRVTQAVNKIFVANVSNRTPCNNLNLSNEIYNGSLIGVLIIKRAIMKILKM